MNRSSVRRDWVTRATRAGWLAATAATLAAASAHAQGPVELSSAPVPENPAWKNYVLGTGTADVKPVRIVSTSGSVTNAEGLIDPSKGPAVLTNTAGGAAPLIVLDYGREVGGLPFFNATAVQPASGTSVTLRSAYSESRAYLTGTGTSLGGDQNGFNGVGVASSRAENFSRSAPGTFGNAANAIQGGQRFQGITVTTPGTIELSEVGIHVRYPNASSDDYAGHFLSSDEKLNKIWYAGAYTNDTNMVPIGAVPNQTIPVILDGAKRDRRPWSGDLELQGRTAFTSLGFGAKGSDYIKGSLLQFGRTQNASGQLFGHIQDWTRNPPSGGTGLLQE